MSQLNEYTECPLCSHTNVQQLDKKSWFCLDCDWDNLSAINNGNDELLSSLKHGDIHTRRIAAQALINIGDIERHIATPSDIGALLEALDDEDSDVRYFVTVALGRLTAERCITKLMALAQNDSSALVREGAQTAIEKLKSTKDTGDI